MKSFYPTQGYEKKIFGMIKIRKVKTIRKNEEAIEKGKHFVMGRNDICTLEKETEYLTPLGRFSRIKIVGYGPSFLVKNDEKKERIRKKEIYKIIVFRSNSDNMKIIYTYKYKDDFLTEKDANEEIQKLIRSNKYTKSWLFQFFFS